MITLQDLKHLVERPATPESPVLSLYLDVDQRRSVNLNRGFETRLEGLLRGFERRLEDERQRAAFAADAERIRRYVAAYRPHGLALCAFADESAGLFWAHDVRVKLGETLRWAETPYVRPLIEALDEYARYGVILTDRTRARLFTVFMGEIEEHEAALAPADVRHVKTAGTDHWRSQMHFQRRADVHARWHLKHVADRIDHLVEQFGFDRLVLAGPVEATHELARLLPKRLRTRVVASAPLPVDASLPDVLESSMATIERVERDDEVRLVEELLTAAGKDSGAVLGLPATLASLKQGRVLRLVYADGLRAPGWRCTNCGTLVALAQAACPECGGALVAVDDLVEETAQRVVELGGKVEPVRGEARERLDAAGGIGAYLRY